MSDVGLASHLAGLPHMDVMAHESIRGAMLETFVAQNLVSLLEAHIPEANLLFWNVQGRHEVDFVIELGQEVMAIEVKSASRWGPRDLSGLQAFLAATPHCRAAVLAYNGTEPAQLEKRLWVLPLRMLLS
jgi:predicted AAA+ superfamily ATPase